MVRLLPVPFVACLSACLVFMAGSACAQKPDVPAPLAPAAIPRPILPAAVSDYLEGRWAGSGVFTRSGKPVSSIFEFVRTLDGEALQVHHREDLPLIFAWQGVISLDTVSGDVVLLMASNQAGGARLMRSRGWASDTLIFESSPDLHTWFARERLTLEKLGPDRFRATYELSRDDGETWTSGDVQIFDRVLSSRQIG